MWQHSQAQSCHSTVRLGHAHHDAGYAQRPHTAMAAVDSRYQQRHGLGQGGPSPSASPSHQTAYHSLPAGAAHPMLSRWPRHDASVPQQPEMPSTAALGQQLQQADAHSSWLPSSRLAGPPDSAQQDVSSGQGASGLQLPMHVQQWLASLAGAGQPGVDQHAAPTRASSAVPSPDAVHAATELHEDVRQLRAELTDVKSKLTETQVRAVVNVSQATQVHRSMVSWSRICCSAYNYKQILGTMLILSQKLMLDL